MNKIAVPYTEHYALAVGQLQRPGLLLATVSADGRPNVMTIGWGTIGEIWGKPIFTVLVRPSRFSYELLEQVDEFTVNLLPKELRAAAGLCGKLSGRDCDKFHEAKLTATPAHTVRVPIVEECLLHYECKVVARVDLDPAKLGPGARGAYPKGDFHRVYYGEILATSAVEDLAARFA